MYKVSKRTCTAIVLLIKPFVWRRSRCRRRRGLLKLPILHHLRVLRVWYETHMLTKLYRRGHGYVSLNSSGLNFSFFSGLRDGSLFMGMTGSDKK